MTRSGRHFSVHQQKPPGAKKWHSCIKQKKGQVVGNPWNGRFRGKQPSWNRGFTPQGVRNL